jgi:hypothetical protein
MKIIVLLATAFFYFPIINNRLNIKLVWDVLYINESGVFNKANNAVVVAEPESDPRAEWAGWMLNE